MNRSPRTGTNILLGLYSTSSLGLVPTLRSPRTNLPGSPLPLTRSTWTQHSRCCGTSAVQEPDASPTLATVTTQTAYSHSPMRTGPHALRQDAPTLVSFAFSTEVRSSGAAANKRASPRRQVKRSLCRQAEDQTRSSGFAGSSRTPATSKRHLHRFTTTTAAAE